VTSRSLTSCRRASSALALAFFLAELAATEHDGGVVFDDPPPEGLVLALDEALERGQVGLEIRLVRERLLTDMARKGVFRNLSQISERWGRDRADTVIANHNARLFGSGIADRATLDYLGAILGDEEIQKISTHRQRLELGSRTYSNDYKRLAAPGRIARQPTRPPGRRWCINPLRPPPFSDTAPGAEASHRAEASSRRRRILGTRLPALTLIQRHQEPVERRDHLSPDPPIW
jgi:hypothetical protein